ncbi:hypothetical protein BJX68DRAFT_269788 [Aspergillus pseudodeflectus]|uniref:Uncharacterized protein n=1 Tax=Aspergillus pseudodeflectus TaxID=176178 RepID=A0ABR4JWT4_9EURO
MDHRKLWFRDSPWFLWYRIEYKVLKHHPTAAQKLRRVLHDKLGLTEKEWAAVGRFFVNHEALGVATQRNEWFGKECARLEKILDNTKNLNAEESIQVSSEYHQIRDEMRQNQDEWRRRVRLLWKAGCDIEHTPIGRALYACQEREGWHMHPWLRLQREQAGGCCGRGCGCCEKRRGTPMGFCVGHCTPACHCCMEHSGLRRPIDALEDPVELGFRVRPTKDDFYSKQMMEVTI